MFSCYIGILYHKKHPREDWHITPGTTCILLCSSSCENPRQKLFWDTNRDTMISSDKDNENWEDEEVGKFTGLRRKESLGG
jgi:hypothetical protein